MASARLRKAFRYPDDSGDDVREELDEEEQERMIHYLRTKNEERDSRYSLIFAAVPLLSTVAFIPSLMSTKNVDWPSRSFCLFGIISLVATAYTMKYVPPQRPDPKDKKPIRKSNVIAHVHSYIVPGNFCVCILLGLIKFLFMGDYAGIQPLTSLLPMAMFATILIVRQAMESIDLKPLEDLQYEYKGP